MEHQLKQVSNQIHSEVKGNFKVHNEQVQNDITTLSNQTQLRGENFEKVISETKVEVGKQMHEICSMVEDIATMAKGLEHQIMLKKPEIESANLNIANLTRKMDESTRYTNGEIQQLKKRQIELTELYSTCLDNDNGGLMNIMNRTDNVPIKMVVETN